jgi:kynurenine formamidase
MSSLIKRRMIDLSVSLQAGIASDPPFMLPEIDYVDHAQSAPDVARIFPGMTPEQLPDGQGWAMERVRLSTHNGTHVDAPWHYHSTMDDGARAITIDEVPLEWCLQPGVKLDFRDKPDGHLCSADDLKRGLDAIEHTLAPLEIVLVNTSAGAAYGQPDYLNRGCGMGREATLFLLDQGVRVVGTDGWSWDAPFSFTAARFAKSRDPSIIWEGHKAGRHKGYCQIEKMANLDQLPASGFIVSCLPVKIHKASGGWTRAVAILDA